MKKYEEGKDYEWRKVEGSNAKARHFFTKEEKASRANRGEAKAAPKPKAATKAKDTATAARAKAVDIHDTVKRSGGSAERPAPRKISKPKKDTNKVKTPAERIGNVFGAGHRKGLSVDKVYTGGNIPKNRDASNGSNRSATLNLGTGKITDNPTTPGPYKRSIAKWLGLDRKKKED